MSKASRSLFVHDMVMPVLFPYQYHTPHPIHHELSPRAFQPLIKPDTSRPHLPTDTASSPKESGLNPRKSLVESRLSSPPMTGTPSSIAARAAVMFRSSAPQLPHSSHKTNPQFVATPHTLPSGKAKIKVDEVKPVTRQQKAFFPAFFSSIRTLSVALLFIAISFQFFHKPFIDRLPRSTSRLDPTPTRLVPQEIFASESTSAVLSTPKTGLDDNFKSFTLCKPNKIYHNDPQPTETIVKEYQVVAADINEMGSSMTLVEKANAIATEFEYTPQQVRDGVKEYIRLMHVGLSNNGEAMTMIPTYVTKVPNGTEEGVYLAVDLGGTNFRVCSVTLKGDTTFTIAQSKIAIPRSLMISDSKSLFSFLAKQISDFVEKHHSDHFAEDSGHHLHLGFTFSFPVDQKAVNKGYLLRWTKGFDIPDAIGKDVCALLQAEIDILGLPVTVAALVNDTVGTLMARSYTSPVKTGTLVGAIFGTGTNGAYVEKLARITKMTKPDADAGEYDKSTGEMVVNTEWGSFDNAMKVLPDTPYDRALDKGSVNPGIQMFEKRVSGMFLGEILRNAILALKDNAGMFSTATIKEDCALYTPWSLDTSVLSYIEADDTPNYLVTRETIWKELGIHGKISSDEAQAIKILVHAIGKRSARLSAVPIAAIILATGKLGNTPGLGVEGLNLKDLSLIEQGVEIIRTAVMGKPAATPVVDTPPSTTTNESSTKAGKIAPDDTIDIGVDGSVVEFYPGFEEHVRSALRDVTEFGEAGEKRVKMGIAKDGSGVGAALIALVAYKMANGLA